MTQDNQLQSTWWGRFSFDSGQTAHWEIGPLKLAIQRLPNEWQLAYEQDEVTDAETTAWVHHPITESIDRLNYVNVERYVLGQTSETLQITPILADRPIVTRPVNPLYVPAGEETTIFVSSPLWLRVEVGDPAKAIQELPIARPSDTWFGPSTMEGELCYASRTKARLNLANIDLPAHRAITAVIIENRASTQLTVERFELPVPYLSLFECDRGVLWTEAVTMERTRDTEMATFQVITGPPEEAKLGTLLSEPRWPPDPKMSIHAFSKLFRDTSWRT
ncbi:MAG: hypothetical protein OES12_05540 [Anaerolineae bacterium]|nr:hypothetical protein [Anaerolineae bacterium]